MVSRFIHAGNRFEILLPEITNQQPVLPYGNGQRNDTGSDERQAENPGRPRLDGRLDARCLVEPVQELKNRKAKTD